MALQLNRKDDDDDLMKSKHLEASVKKHFNIRCMVVVNMSVKPETLSTTTRSGSCTQQWLKSIVREVGGYMYSIY